METFVAKDSIVKKNYNILCNNGLQMRIHLYASVQAMAHKHEFICPQV